MSWRHSFAFLISAMSVVTLSGCLEGLTQQQPVVSDLASNPEPALPVNHPSPPVPGEPSGGAEKVGAAFSGDVLGSRFYIRSFLSEIFSAPANPSATYALTAILDKYLGADTEDGVSGAAAFDYMSLFGGPCDYYSEAGSGKACGGSPSNLNLPLNVPSNTSRESIREKVCAEITGNDLLIDAALSKISRTRSSSVTDDGLQAAFDLFYPGVAMDAATLGAFKNLNTAQKNNHESTLNQWRMLYFTLCRTPEWQML